MKSKKFCDAAALCILFMGLSVNAAEPPLLKPFGLEPVNFAELERVDSILAKGFANMTPAEKELFFKYEIQGPYETVTNGSSWYNAGGPLKTEASSFLPAQGKFSYEPAKAHDFDMKTAWVEGKKDYGIGQFIEYSFPPKSPRVNRVIIYNGFQLNRKTWEDNSRVKIFKLYVNGSLHSFLSLKDVTGPQVFAIGPQGSDREGVSLKLRFEIAEVYEGKRWKDTAVSEINFDGLDVN